VKLKEESVMHRDFIFSSESVTEGHPDKLCDQISDAIVDHILMQDPYARVRAECAVSSAIVFIAARFATSAKVDLPYLARKVIKKIGYESQEFNAKSCSILTAPKGFPPNKHYLFEESELDEKGINNIKVKNQVTVFGFACNQTPDYMPMPIWLANRLSRQIDRVRHDKDLPYLEPDAKVQVGIEYKNRKPYRVHGITLTTSQKKEGDPSQKKLKQDMREWVIDPALSDVDIKFDSKSRIFVNPDGPIIGGGPARHSGLTGRKSAVDTYGEFSRHSGDALSGKDPLRVDRVGAYAARHAAKNIVSSGLADECEVAITYSIGLSKPVSIQVLSIGTNNLTESDIGALLKANYDFRLGAIVKNFQLRRLPSVRTGGFFQRLAAYGHMGRQDFDVPWEKLDREDIFK
jgi:S-adenosylmethionine synthetase